MTINLKIPEAMADLKPRITVFGVGGAGGNAVNNMIQAGLEGVEFVVANTDAQALAMSSAERRVQMGTAITEGLGAGSRPQIGAAAAEEAMAEILDYIAGSHMVFITAGMGGGTGTGAAPVIARLAREQDILTVGVVTKPFQFEGARRMTIAEEGIEELQKHVDTLIVIPNQNLFRVANERTTFADAFAMADQVLYSGVAGITDLMVKEGLINLDFADVRTIMSNMGKAMMGTGEACGEKRAIEAAEAAISNPLLDEVSMKGARGLLISITGGEDLTLYEVDEAATRIRTEVDPEANIILGATFDHALEGYIRVSVVATGIEGTARAAIDPAGRNENDVIERTGVTSTFGNFESGRSKRPGSPLVAGASAGAAASGAFDHAAYDGYYYDDHGGELDDAAAVGQVPPAAAHGGAAYAESEVTVRRVDARKGIARRAARRAEADPDAAVPAHDPSRPFIPPEPAEVQQTGTRMPRIDEFPVIAQRELAARDREPEHHGVEAQKRKAGFLERLASVGLGRRDPGPRSEEPAEPWLTEPEMPRRPSEDPLAGYPVHRAEFMPMQPPQAHPVPTRQTAMAQEDEDDQLEIPAFLRRQAN